MTQRPLSASEIEEYSAEARDLSNNKLMKRLWADMESLYITQLKSSNVGDLSATTAHASLRVLEDVKAQINLYASRRIK